MFNANLDSLTCRNRHLKCDKKQPACTNCRNSLRECVPVDTAPLRISFRHGQNPSCSTADSPNQRERDTGFSTDQVWLPVNCSLTFEDETDSVEADYFVANTVSYVPGHERSKAPHSSSPLSLVSSVSFPNSASQTPAEGATESPTSMYNHHVYERLLAPTESRLSDCNEAFLLHHFGRVLGPWLDVCDKEKHFSIEVPMRAPSCPLLLYACLAVSARHLSQTTGYDYDVADRYHSRCIKLLIPMLDDSLFEQQIDVILASTVILRLFEQISSDVPTHDLQRHLLGGSAFVNSGRTYAVVGGLTGAAFWYFVIQDIQVALAYQQPLRMRTDSFADCLYSSWQESQVPGEQTWTQKAIWLVVETIQLCFTSGPSYDYSEVEQLMGRIREWEQTRPDSFSPLFHTQQDLGNLQSYPQVWYCQPWHLAAAQHLCIAKVLLAGQHIRSLGMGLGSGYRSRILHEEVSAAASTLFGAALSTNEAPGRFTACHALCSFGSWITSRWQQEALLEMLRQTERDHGWPWSYVVRRLVEDWNLSAAESTTVVAHP